MQAPQAMDPQQRPATYGMNTGGWGFDGSQPGSQFQTSSNEGQSWTQSGPGQDTPQANPNRWNQADNGAAPGPGTADALRAEGIVDAAIVEPAPDAPQFDSEALWQRLAGHDWQGTSVLVVRGDGGRDWLAGRLVEAGAAVDTVAAYARVAPQLSAEERRSVAAAFADPEGHAWLFSSSEAIANLESLAGTPWPNRARAIATHPRIAARARQAGFASVSEVPPGLDAVVACIQSMRP